MTPSAKSLLAPWLVEGIKEVATADQDAYQVTISKLLNKEELSYWIGLIKFFCGFKAEEEADELVREFSKDAPKFPVRDNEQLLRVLAGCLLAQKTESNSPVTNAVILALLTINFSIDKITLPLPEVLTRTEALWKEKCKANRALLKPSKLSTVPTKEKPLTAADQKLFISSIGPFFLDIEKRVAANSEETNVLSWIYSSYSQAIDASFKQIGATKLSFIGAKELADFTLIPLGLPTARGILSKMLEGGGDPATEVTLADIVHELTEAAPYTTWVAETSKPRLITSGESVTPLLYALYCSKEYKEGDWRPTFKVNAGFAADFTTNLLAFAMQFYKECILMSIIRGKL